MYFLPRSGVDLRELVLVDVTVRVHLHDLIIRRSAEHLDDLHQLVDVTVRTENGLKGEHLNQDAASRPHVDLRRVASAGEDKLRSAVAPRTDVGEIRFSLLQSFC